MATRLILVQLFLVRVQVPQQEENPRSGGGFALVLLGPLSTSWNMRGLAARLCRGNSVLDGGCINHSPQLIPYLDTEHA